MNTIIEQLEEILSRRVSFISADSIKKLQWIESQGTTYIYFVRNKIVPDIRPWLPSENIAQAYFDDYTCYTSNTYSPGLSVYCPMSVQRVHIFGHHSNIVNYSSLWPKLSGFYGKEPSLLAYVQALDLFKKEEA